MDVIQEPNYWGPMAQNLANSLSNMLGFGPQQQWQGLLQSLGQSGLLGQTGGGQQQPMPYAGMGGEMITPEGGQLPGQGAMQGSWPGVGGAPQANMTGFGGGINLQALAGVRDPRMQQMLLALLGQQVMSPLEQAQTRALGQPVSPYGKPPWYVSPEAQQTELGQIAGGLKPRAGRAEKPLPEGYMEDLANAVNKLREVEQSTQLSPKQKGQLKVAIYQRMASEYRDRSLEIQRILLARNPETALFEFSFGTEEAK